MLFLVCCDRQLSRTSRSYEQTYIHRYVGPELLRKKLLAAVAPAIKPRQNCMHTAYGDIQIGLQIFRKFNICENFPEISGNIIAKAWKLKRL